MLAGGLPNRPKGDSGLLGRGVFLALHMALIPRGVHQGKILIWSHQHYAGENPIAQTPAPAVTRPLYWSLYDPASGSFENYMWYHPENKGDLFCSGHAWDQDGNLFIAGGTMHHGVSINGQGGWSGSRMTFFYDTSANYGLPSITGPTNPWVPGPDLAAVRLWDPVFLQWFDAGRWYPSVTHVGVRIDRNNQVPSNWLIVAGGTNYSIPENSHQLLTEATGQWYRDPNLVPPDLFDGPRAGTGQSNYYFSDYPRAVLLSDGKVMTAGFSRGSDRVDISSNPEAWSNLTWLMAAPRWYGSAVLMPIRIQPPFMDYVLAFGGQSSAGVSADVQRTLGSAANPTWTGAPTVPQLQYPRMFPNSVLMADGSILVVGGRQENDLAVPQCSGGFAPQSYGCTSQPAYIPEQYINGQWQKLDASDIIRDYHSTALLLPDGNVLVGGGESREWNAAGFACQEQCNPPAGEDRFYRSALGHPVDYQVFVPPYNDTDLPRPRILGQAAAGSAWDWFLGTTVTINWDKMPDEATVAKVLLIAPGSITHHADTNQRCVELEVTEIWQPFPPDGTGTLIASVPGNDKILPKGYYMLFLVTSQDTICERAAWVKVQ